MAAGGREGIRRRLLPHVAAGVARGGSGLAESLSAEPPRTASDQRFRSRPHLHRAPRSMHASRAEILGVSVEEVRGQAETQIPLGLYGTPENYPGVPAFFASPAST